MKSINCADDLSMCKDRLLFVRISWGNNPVYNGCAFSNCLSIMYIAAYGRRAAMNTWIQIFDRNEEAMHLRSSTIDIS